MTDHEATIARLEEQLKAVRDAFASYKQDADKDISRLEKRVDELGKIIPIVEGAVTAIKYHWYLLGGIVLILIGYGFQFFRAKP